MTTLTDITQNAADGDLVTGAWVNSLRAKLNALDAAIATASSQIGDLRSQLSQAFRVTAISGLLVAYAGGTVKLSASGIVVTVAPGQLTLPASSTSWIYLDATGTMVSSTTRPTIGLEVATVTTNATTVTAIVNFPIFVVQPNLNLDNYATIAYANSRAWEQVAYGRRTTSWIIPAAETFYTIPFETLQGVGLNTAGVFTAPAGTRSYVFHVQVRVDTTAVFTSSLSVKISLFVEPSGGSLTEYGILAQSESARGDITLNAENAQPISLSGGDKVTARVYLTQGVSARVRENSQIKVWGLPV